jgi:glycosyltransferase involved in cell wall biosynthesis
MNDKPLVSIIVPAYNAEKYFGAAIESAFAQTYPNIEIIVVNDGSTDGTAEVEERYRNRITYIQQENAGVGAARKNGIDHARGEFITFLDADDLLCENKVERQVQYLMNHPECGVCYSAIYHFKDGDPEHLMTLEAWHFSGAEVFPNLLWKNFINPLTVMIRKSVLDQFGTFDPKRRRAEDWELWLRLSYAGVQFCYIPEWLARYRVTEVSLSRGRKNIVPERIAMLKIFTDLRARLPRDQVKKYNLDRVVMSYRAKLWYAKISMIFGFLDAFRLWLQKKRYTAE